MISPVTDAYLPVLAALHAACFPEEPWSETALRTVLGSAGMYGFIDERGGFLLLRVVLDEAEIISIGATARRQGVASALLTRGVDEARARGVSAIYLEVAAQNTAAQALYARFGFEKVGLRKRYYENGADALTLRLGLA